MAQEVLTRLLDDIDGSDATETVKFALDGVGYEIDLNDKNAAALRKALAKYIDKGRRAGSGGASRARRRGGRGGAADPRQVRAWAAEAGIQLSSRGRIPQSIIDQYRASGG